MSLERVELLAAAQARQRAAFLLEIGQVCGLAFAGGHEWQKKQRELIERATPPSATS